MTTLIKEKAPDLELAEQDELLPVDDSARLLGALVVNKEIQSPGHRRFNIQPTIEQTSFESETTQSFFSEWCHANDSIEPEVISRSEWDEKVKTGILQKRPDGKKSLYIPKDLKLWEMISLIEVIDKDTFTDKPDRQKESVEKLSKLGKKFQNAGIYLAQRADCINDGREIAETLAEEFYNYGLSLSNREKPEEPIKIDEIATIQLSEQELTQIDQFLAGDTLYESRRAKAEKESQLHPERKTEIYEAMRQKTMSQFFRVSERAFVLKGADQLGQLKESATTLKPWQSDISAHDAFIERIEESMSRQIETPKRETNSAIFRRGMELLQKNMPFDELMKYKYFKNLLSWQNGEKTLREALQIDEMKTELEEVRKSGDIEKISQKEREIANKIQIAICGYKYGTNTSNPSEILATQNRNCVGASLLGGALFEEVGLNYLVGLVPSHSILILVTGDRKIVWKDMLATAESKKSIELEDKDIAGIKKDGSTLQVEDIVSLCSSQTARTITCEITLPNYEDFIPPASNFRKGQQPFLVISTPRDGLEAQVLLNIANDFSKLKNTSEEFLSCELGADLLPEYNFYHYLNMALLFEEQDQMKEAIVTLQKAIKSNEKNHSAYIILGRILYNSHQFDKAIEILHKARLNDKNNPEIYKLLEKSYRAIDDVENAQKAGTYYKKCKKQEDQKKQNSW